MALTSFPNGISSFGVPVVGPSIPTTTGNVWFVSSVIGAAGNLGTDSARPLATLAQAVSAATANNGDVIVLMPGHAETITGAAGVSIAKAGLYIVGIGTGAKRATFTYTTAIAASFDISAAQTTIVNCAFIVGFDAITAMVNVTGVDVSFVNCEVTTNTATLGTVLGILTAATATRFRVDGCRFLGTATNSGTTTTAQIKHEVGVDYQIVNNYFAGKMTQAILNTTTVLRGLIDNNRFVVGTGTVAITMAAASTPFITNNNMNVASGTAPIVAAAGFVSRNSYSAAAGVTAGTAVTI